MGHLARKELVVVPLGRELVSDIAGNALEVASLRAEATVSGVDREDQLTLYDDGSVKTDVVLLANQHVDAETIRKVADAVIGSHFFLWPDGPELEEKMDRMVYGAPSIPMHAAATRYFRDNDLMPPNRKLTALDYLQRLGVVVLALLTMSRGFVTTFKVAWLERRILRVPVGCWSRERFEELNGLRERLRTVATRKWWPLRVSASRWQVADELVEKRQNLLRNRLAAGVLEEIRAARRAGETGEEKLESLRDRVLTHTQRSELTEDESSFLLEQLPVKIPFELQPQPPRSSRARRVRKRRAKREGQRGARPPRE